MSRGSVVSLIRIGGLFGSAIYGGVQLAQTAFGLPLGLANDNAQSVFWTYLAIILFFFWNVGFYWNKANGLENQRPRIILKNLSVDSLEFHDSGYQGEVVILLLNFYNEPKINIPQAIAKNVTAEISLSRKRKDYWWKRYRDIAFGIWLDPEVVAATAISWGRPLSRKKTTFKVDIKPNGIPAMLLFALQDISQQTYVLNSKLADELVTDDHENLHINIRGDNVGPHIFDIPITRVSDPRVSERKSIEFDLFNRVEIERGKIVSMKRWQRNVFVFLENLREEWDDYISSRNR